MLIVYGLAAAVIILFVIVFNRSDTGKQAGLIRLLVSDRVKGGLKKVYLAEDTFYKGIEFYKKKINVAVITVLAGLLAAFAYELVSMGSSGLINGNMIMRNGYQGSPRNVRIRVRDIQTEESQVIDVKVSERKYSIPELEQMAAEADAVISEFMLAGNGSLDRITEDMDFPTSIKGCPFRISWRTDDPLLISSKGVLDRERLNKLKEKKDISEGIVIGIHAELSYEDYLYEMHMTGRVYQDNSDKEYSLAEYLKLMIDELDLNTREDEYLVLPERVENIGLVYEEVGGKKSVLLLLMVIVAAAAMYFREDQELINRVRRRDMELMNDYPVLVNKFVLFYSAGLTTRGIWSKLCRDYRIKRDKDEKKNRRDTGKKENNKRMDINKKKGRKYLYEEMLLCEGWMNEGMGETAAYEAFAARCGLNRYRQFISLISQAMGKGRADLLPMLEREAQDAFTERKNRAKELGEEAGTKLLFPMMLMLLIVLIIVMVPAFVAFRI
ncbi:MAG: type II secretion system F family protein [Lachnospiraceae bacterium]|nr:type II secretion system F family protein [Lachnospiraceae bacterium]